MNIRNALENTLLPHAVYGKLKGNRVIRHLALALFVIFAAVSCGGSSNIGDDPADTSSSSTFTGADSLELADAQPAQTDGPYSAVLHECAIAKTNAEACSFETLPLLGVETGGKTPTVDEVMSRVLSSHAWMTDNFRAVLERLPNEFLALFRAVTVVVMDADILPAYYTSLTAAIYLDPSYLWLTVENKRTLDAEKEDFRANFADELQFRNFSHYLTADDQYQQFGSLEDDSTRSFSEMEAFLARLLAHELAHANDYFPVSSYVNIDNTLTPSENASTFFEKNMFISGLLNAVNPLRSEMLAGIGQVMYRGLTASDEQKQITGAEAGDAFADDRAAANYAYSSVFEDTAMLFEQVMMKRFYQYNFIQSFISQDVNEDNEAFWRVDWGIKNPLGRAEVKERALFVAERLLPETPETDGQWAQFLSEMDASTLLQPGYGIGELDELLGNTDNSATNNVSPSPLPAAVFNPQYFQHHLHAPHLHTPH